MLHIPKGLHKSKRSVIKSIELIIECKLIVKQKKNDKIYHCFKGNKLMKGGDLDKVARD